MSAGQVPTLATVWPASVAAARASLAAVERGELRASSRQQEAWRQNIERAQSWGLA